MIITKTKDIEEITKSLAGLKSVYLFGCNACAEQCKTGGAEEISSMTRALSEKGFDVTGSSLIDETCYRQPVRKEFRQHKEINESDAVLVLACGAGVKSVMESNPETQPVIPALNSIYLAKVERVGQFFEGCSLCGECVLANTGGICPHTDCPKGLLNGPCGGVVDGQCEVDIDNSCAWVKIYEKLKIQNRLHLMEEIAAPKDYSVGGRPRKTRVERRPGKDSASEGAKKK
jgi:ferredoxin